MRNLASYDRVHDTVSKHIFQLSGKVRIKTKHKQMTQTRKKKTKKRKSSREKPEMRKKQRKACGAKTTAWGGNDCFQPKSAGKKYVDG